MYPIALDLTRMHILLIGKGETLTRRLLTLEESGASQVTLHDTTKTGFDASHLHDLLQQAQCHVLMVTGLSDEESVQLAGFARARHIPVNVEDKPDLCDFYFMSLVRRGPLTLAVSTGGASPTLSQEIRAYLERLFGSEWEEFVPILAAKRLAWKKEGHTNAEVARLTREFIHAQGLLHDREET